MKTGFLVAVVIVALFVLGLYISIKKRGQNSIVGTWEMKKRDYEERYAFRSDGKVEISDGKKMETGDWHVDGDELQIRDNRLRVERFSFSITDDGQELKLYWRGPRGTSIPNRPQDWITYRRIGDW